MACQHVEIFFRICGHVTIGMIHSAPCIEAFTMEHAFDPGAAETCWNPLGQKPFYIYALRPCNACHPPIEMAKMEGHDWRIARLLDRLSRPETVIARIYNPREIKIMAETWKARILEQERVSRVQKRIIEADKKMRADRKRQRFLHDINWWLSNPEYRDRPKKYYLWDLSKGGEQATSFLEKVDHLEPGDDYCGICRDTMELEDARRIPCRFGHIFHWECITGSLIYSQECPLRDGEFQIFYHHTWDEPMYHWFPDENHSFQVAGAVSVDLNLENIERYQQLKGFRTGVENPNRWGDELPDGVDDVLFRPGPNLAGLRLAELHVPVEEMGV